VQRIGFVQNDEKAQGLSIGSFLAEMQGHQKALGVMCQLRVLGHPHYQAAEPYDQQRKTELRPPVLASEQDTVPQLSFGALSCELREWRRRLDEATARHASLRFYSTAVAQWLHNCLLRPKSTTTAFELALALCSLYPCTPAAFAELQRVDLNELPRGIETPLDGEDAVDLAVEITVEREWPTQVGLFLEAVQRGMELSDFAFNHVPAAEHWIGVHVHTVEPVAEDLLRLILSIFRRLPTPHEVLWCERSTSASSVSAFLERATRETPLCFVMIHVDLLAPTVLQVLLKYLLASRDASAQQSLHCIQTSSTNLQATSWIKHHHHHRSAGSSRVVSRDLAKQLLAGVLDGQCVSSVTWLLGGSGSGKTHLARKQLAVWGREGCTTCTMSITEAFSLAEAARVLREAVLEHGSARRMGVSFHINLGKFRSRERQQWVELMARINRFFFSLLVLRSVAHPESGLLFNIPSGSEWAVLVELPHRGGHLDEDQPRADSDPSWVFEELPVVALVGTMQTPPAVYDIDDEARLVCKYLNAYVDGTIDCKYGGASMQSVDMCIVMDCTSSMSRWINEAQEKMLRIVEAARERFGVSVRVSFVGYRDYCDGRRILDSMDFVEEQAMPGELYPHMNAQPREPNCTHALSPGTRRPRRTQALYLSRVRSPRRRRYRGRRRRWAAGGDADVVGKLHPNCRARR